VILPEGKSGFYAPLLLRNQLVETTTEPGVRALCWRLEPWAETVSFLHESVCRTQGEYDLLFQVAIAFHFFGYVEVEAKPQTMSMSKPTPCTASLAASFTC
jgi:hypothetical protein